jgi:hypothetical protein
MRVLMGTCKAARAETTAFITPRYARIVELPARAARSSFEVLFARETFRSSDAAVPMSEDSPASEAEASILLSVVTRASAARTPFASRR